MKAKPPKLDHHDATRVAERNETDSNLARCYLALMQERNLWLSSRLSHPEYRAFTALFAAVHDVLTESNGLAPEFPVTSFVAAIRELYIARNHATEVFTQPLDSLQDADSAERNGAFGTALP